MVIYESLTDRFRSCVLRTMRLLNGHVSDDVWSSVNIITHVHVIAVIAAYCIRRSNNAHIVQYHNRH